MSKTLSEDSKKDTKGGKRGCVVAVTKYPSFLFGAHFPGPSFLLTEIVPTRRGGRGSPRKGEKSQKIGRLVNLTLADAVDTLHSMHLRRSDPQKD